MATYSIRDLENISGIKAHTLRIWEQRYEILKPKRTDTNIRFYEEEDLRLLLSISMLNSNGYKISNIAKMSAEEIHEACRKMGPVGNEVSSLIDALTLAMIELDEARFEKTLASSTLKFGFEDTMMRVVYPFFQRVGILWQTGAIRPVQEHFMSNLVRQKLVVAIDAQQVGPASEGYKFALYLPEHEMHELGLLFAAYLLRARKHHVIYLGQNVPEDDLASVFDAYQPDYFFLALTITPPKESAESYLTRLGKQFPKVKFLATGNAIELQAAMPDNVILFKQVTDLLHYLKSI